ncbi:protein of unknown function DUF2431 containing protein [Nitzschia inconspicua]|uniref:HTH OST-type domain-containing protein n=1 Tax=Nitzschia inconspicua TaxID=303405 RepID=A0A9K3L2V4_9STRA|nr:protein of unknown function DUF2431 containing protein [Nitzschia inconspicua]
MLAYHRVRPNGWSLCNWHSHRCFNQVFRHSSKQRYFSFSDLLGDIRKEFNSRWDFYKKTTQNLNQYHRLQSKLASRADWKDKLTEREKRMINEHFGEATLATLEKKGNITSEDEKLLLRYGLLEAIEKFPAMTDEEKKFAKDSVQKDVQNAPSLRPNGLPVNGDVLRSFEKYKRVLKMPSVSSINVVQNADIKSPFGPMSSALSIEEFGPPIQLKHLMLHFGHPVPQKRIILTIVTDAVISPAKSVSMVVADELGQYVLMQIYNLREAEVVERGFTPGARYILKNPFLKHGRDAVPFLRVDQPFDLIRLDLPPLEGKILVVGDGDFSFSVALATSNRIRGSAAITATSLDSLDQVKVRYRNGGKNLRVLSSVANVTVRHGIDATKLEHVFDEEEFDSIVWNFPYPEEQVIARSGEGKSLISGFLKSSKNCLALNGRIYLTLAHKQGGTSYEVASNRGWNLEEVARNLHFDVIDALPFAAEDFPGYSPKRAYNDKSFPHSDSRTHILTRKDAPIQNGAAKRSTISSLLTLLADFRWGSLGWQSQHWTDAVEDLRPYCTKYKTARSLYEAALSFGTAIEYLQNSPHDQIQYTLPSSDFIVSLAKVHKTIHGELLVRLRKDDFDSAMLATKAALSSMFSEASKEEFMENELTSVQNLTDCLRILRKEIPRSLPKHLNEVENCIIVLSNLAMHIHFEDKKSVLLFQISSELFPTNPLFVLRHANALANSELKDMQDTSEEVLREIQSLAERAMTLSQEGSPIYISAAYLWGAMEIRRPRESADWSKAAEHFKKCINWMEECERLLPRAYINLAYVSFMKCKGESNPVQMFQNMPADVREYVSLGVKAEAKTLPFFSSQEKFPIQRFLAALLINKSKKDKEKRSDEMSRSNSSLDGKGEVDSLRCRNKRMKFFENLKQLLKSWESGDQKNPLHVSLVKEQYHTVFGKPIPTRKKETLFELLKKAEIRGCCRLEQNEDGNTWVIRQSTLATTFANLAALLSKLTLEGRVSTDISQLKKLYMEHFGESMPLEDHETLLDFLKKAEEKGYCKLSKKKSGAWVISAPKI